MLELAILGQDQDLSIHLANVGGKCKFMNPKSCQNIYDVLLKFRALKKTLIQRWSMWTMGGCIEDNVYLTVTIVGMIHRVMGYIILSWRFGYSHMAQCQIVRRKLAI